MERIREIFERNFAERGELGASLSVWKDGEEILSLHQGWRDRDRSTEWNDETIVPVWSMTKGPAAVTTLLALQGAGVSPSAPVRELWPELRAAESGKLTFAKLLAHQSGLPYLDEDNRPPVLDRAGVVAALESQEPAWEPGREHGYHPRTYGYLLEEIVKRATGGAELGRYWKEKLADPLRLDFHIGNLGSSEIERLATISAPSVQRPNPEEIPFYRAIARPDSVAAAAFSSPAGMRALSDINKLEYLNAGLSSLGGVGGATGLAKFYQVLAQGGELDGVRVIPRSVVEATRSPLGNREDRTFLMPTAFTAGFMRDPLDESGGKIRHHYGPSHRAFGQPGAGGSHAFTDPENGISFAYVMNQMETGVLPNRKSLDLVEALYEELRPG